MEWKEKNKSVQKITIFYDLIDFACRICVVRLTVKRKRAGSFIYYIIERKKVFRCRAVAIAKYIHVYKSISNKKLLLCSNELIKCLSSSVYYSVCFSAQNQERKEKIELLPKSRKFSPFFAH